MNGTNTPAEKLQLKDIRTYNDTEIEYVKQQKDGSTFDFADSDGKLRPYATPPEVVAEIELMAAQIGARCIEHDMPFLLTFCSKLELVEDGRREERLVNANIPGKRMSAELRAAFALVNHGGEAGDVTLSREQAKDLGITIEKCLKDHRILEVVVNLAKIAAFAAHMGLDPSGIVPSAEQAIATLVAGGGDEKE